MFFVFKIHYVLLIQYLHDAIFRTTLQSCAWLLKYRPLSWHSELVALVEYEVNLVNGWGLAD